jgi:maleylpyruvate isomerase
VTGAVDLVAAAHARLASTLEAFDAPSSAAPSALPGWSRAHVLTHLARNADSNTWILDGARAGEVREQYPGGPTTRAAAIDAGAGRPVEEVIADARRAFGRLEAAYGRMAAADWERTVRPGVRDMTAAELVWSRLREVEVHHADLSLGYGPTAWPAEFVAGELPRQAPELERRLPTGTALRIAATDTAAAWEVGQGPASLSVSGPACWLLAWVLGRQVPGRVLSAPAGLPSLRPW